MSAYSEIPNYSDSFLEGQDILYAEYNDLDFFVEDINSEYFYLNILRKLFPNISLQKIFPLNGKDKVIKNAQENTGNKRKVYIVDLDFDHILNKRKEISNLFYLNKYSVENHLFNKDGIFELIRSKFPKYNNDKIESLFDYSKVVKHIADNLVRLSCSFVLIQKFELGINYYGLNPNEDFKINKDDDTVVSRNENINIYISSIGMALTNKDGRCKYHTQEQKIKQYYGNNIDILSNIPGKYILNFTRCYLHKHGLIDQVREDTFAYLLSKEINIDELSYLKTDIIDYVS